MTIQMPLLAQDEGAEVLPRQIMVMHRLYGQSNNHCQYCSHLILTGYGRRTVFKCEEFGFTPGPGTDWNQKWPACGRFKHG